MKRQRGVLTIEAAIATPVFILVLLFIVNFLNIFYLQLVIQQGLNNVAGIVSEYCYAVNLVGNIDDFALSGETKGKETKLTGAIEQAVSSASRTLEILNGNISLDTLPELVESGKQFYESVKIAKDTVGDISKDDVTGYLLSTAVDAGGGSIVSFLMDDYLKEMQVNLNLLDGPVYYHVYIDKANADDLIFIAAYRYKHPMMSVFQESIPLRQVVRVHPWIGGTSSKGLRGVKK